MDNMTTSTNQPPKMNPDLTPPVLPKSSEKVTTVLPPASSNSLVPPVTGGNIGTPAVTAQPKQEQVSIGKLELKNILDRLNTLEEGKISPRITKILTRTAKVRFLDEKLSKMVIGYGKSWEKKDVAGRKYLMIEVKALDEDDKEITETVEYTPFAEQGYFVVGEILEIMKKEVEKKMGTVFATEVDYNNYRSKATDKEVPLLVKSLEVTYKLRLPDGREVKVPAEGLN